jgi:poly-beta-1,6-N-acetyl-D-glucosamine synthase
MSLPRYVIITPVRNEERYLVETLESVVRQSVKPQKWILVNDGSTDQTGSIIDRASQQHSWITAVHRPDRGFRKAGGGVIESFYDGYALVRDEPWDYLVKLDGDLTFDASFFADCFDRFNRDPQLGLGGGTICKNLKGVLVAEAKGDPPFHVRGATKIYRRACWEAIGGLLKAPGWDTLDEIKANMLGWRTYSFPELKLHHHRHAGDADGAWKNWVKNGRANFITGYHPLFMLVKCLQRLFTRPYVVAGLGLGVGFFGCYLKHTPRVEDDQLIAYLRQQQMNRLLLRKNLWDAPASRAPLGGPEPMRSGETPAQKQEV